MLKSRPASDRLPRAFPPTSDRDVAAARPRRAPELTAPLGIGTVLLGLGRLPRDRFRRRDLPDPETSFAGGRRFDVLQRLRTTDSKRCCLLHAVRPPCRSGAVRACSPFPDPAFDPAATRAPPLEKPWSNGYFAFLLVMTVIAPMVGLIGGAYVLHNTAKRTQGQILLAVGAVVTMIYVVMMASERKL